MRGKWVAVAVSVILLAAAAGALSVLVRSRSSVPTPSPPPLDPATAEEVSLTGTVRAQNVVGLPAPLEGTLENLMVAVGGEVHEGQILAQIRNTAIEAEIATAKEEVKRAEERVQDLDSLVLAARLEASRAHAAFGRAQSEYMKTEQEASRQQMLFREGATPRRVYEAAQAELRAQQTQYDTMREAARAADERVSALVRELDSARTALREVTEELEFANAELLAAEVVSPVNGIITAMAAIAGGEVHPQKGNLFEIAVELSRLEVVVEPAPPFLERIRPDQAAEVRVAEAPDEAFAASVSEIRDGIVVVEFISGNTIIMPGVSAQVRIKLT